jgi:hypothetical protein
MSPRYEVEIPPTSSSQFGEVVQRLGGTVIKTTRTKEETAAPAKKLAVLKQQSREQARENASEVWARRVKPAQALIDKLEQEQEEDVKEKSNAGINKLIRDAFRLVILPKGSRLKSLLPLNEIRQELISIFRDLTSDTIPEEVYHSAARGKVCFRTRSSGLLPNEVIALIEQYSLADGEPKSARIISKMYEIHHSVISQTKYYGLDKIGQDRKIKSLVLTQW